MVLSHTATVLSLAHLAHSELMRLSSAEDPSKFLLEFLIACTFLFPPSQPSGWNENVHAIKNSRRNLEGSSADDSLINSEWAKWASESTVAVWESTISQTVSVEASVWGSSEDASERRTVETSSVWAVETTSQD
eukprot:TRINITY_DN4572_c0_g1_i1.p1 TRINITY_DN4572_c0_g1~~TRINITY_DN4572_c0_g1_i1.p1  ORF type:complete len:134 (+),score=12.39 TRINITY_DN4572_c0_g1_i1:188-589(+)